MSLIETLENEGASALTAIEHSAAWLVGTLARSATALHTLEASSPLIAEAIQTGMASAAAHGVPLATIVDVGGAVLEAAHAFVNGLTEPPHA